MLLLLLYGSEKLADTGSLAHKASWLRVSLIKQSKRTFNLYTQLHFGVNSITRIYTGQTLYFDERKRETLSVLIWSNRSISFYLAASPVPLKKPSSPKCLLYSLPSHTSLMFFFLLFKGCWSSSGISNPDRKEKIYIYKQIQPDKGLNERSVQ